MCCAAWLASSARIRTSSARPIPWPLSGAAPSLAGCLARARAPSRLCPADASNDSRATAVSRWVCSTHRTSARGRAAPARCARSPVFDTSNEPSAVIGSCGISSTCRTGQGQPAANSPMLPSRSVAAPSGAVLSSETDTRPRALPPKGRAEVAQLVEHRPEEAGVVSSNLTLGTTQWGAHRRQSGGSGSVGRASPCQGEGRGFESRLPLHFCARLNAVRRSTC